MERTSIVSPTSGDLAVGCDCQMKFGKQLYPGRIAASGKSILHYTQYCVYIVYYVGTCFYIPNRKQKRDAST